MNDHLKALFYYKMTLDIEQKSLPSNHPLLAVTYHNMSDRIDHPLVLEEENVLQRLHGKL
jgi:hypothetical protein